MRRAATVWPTASCSCTPAARTWHHLAALVDAGELKPVTDRVFPFERMADAFAYLEQARAKGKVVVKL